jgi:hypothetical protein
MSVKRNSSPCNALRPSKENCRFRMKLFTIRDCVDENGRSLSVNLEDNSVDLRAGSYIIRLAE